MRWPTTPAGRAAAALIAVVVGLNLLVVVVDAVAPSPGGRPSSSLATSERGFAAWAELARRRGVEVVPLRTPLDEARLPAGATVVALDVPDLGIAQARALRAHLRAGGRVLAGGRSPERWLQLLTGGMPWAPEGPETVRPDGVPGVGVVRTAGEGRWLAGGGPLLREAEGGRLRLLADASPLQNRLLGEADNAALALALSGSGPLVFAEAAHGYGRARGLAALPAAGKWALGLLALAAVLLLAARGRRFGPPEADRRPLDPPRVAYVDAVAATLARTGRPAEAMAPVRAAALERLALAPDAEAEAVRAAALEAGLGEEDATALAAPGERGHDGALAVARAHAHLTRTGGRR